MKSFTNKPLHILHFSGSLFKPISGQISYFLGEETGRTHIMHHLGSDHRAKLSFTKFEQQGMGRAGRAAGLSANWDLFFLMGTDKLYMNDSGFTTTEHGLTLSILEFMLQTSPATCNKLALKTLKYQEVCEGHFLKPSSPFPHFSFRPVFEKLGFHFLETLEHCRAETKQKAVKQWN